MFSRKCQRFSVTSGTLIWSQFLGFCGSGQVTVSRPRRVTSAMQPRRKHRLSATLLIGALLAARPAAAVAQLPPGGINLKALFAAVGRMHNIDADLLAAMAEVESGGD